MNGSPGLKAAWLRSRKTLAMTVPAGNNAVNYPLLARPHVQLHGTVDDMMYARFKTQLADAPPRAGR